MVPTHTHKIHYWTTGIHGGEGFTNTSTNGIAMFSWILRRRNVMCLRDSTALSNVYITRPPTLRNKSCASYTAVYAILRGLNARYIHHGFQFDRISPYKPANDLPSDQLDDVSRISIKTLPFPKEVKDRLFTLIKSVAKKKHLDACGSYVAKRLAARRCVEVPRVLPSSMLSEMHAWHRYDSPLGCRCFRKRV